MILQKLIFYNFLPNIFKMALWSIGSVLWSWLNKDKFSKCDLLWSTNPNTLTPHKKGSGSYL